MKRKSGLPLLFTILALLALGSWYRAARAGPVGMISGTVRADGAPIEGASVRIRATENNTLTDANGAFMLTGLVPGEEVEVTAWYDGFYIASTHAIPPETDLTLELRPYHTEDNPDYNWASPTDGEGACANCHPMILEQWQSNAHGSAVENARFFSMYNGTDLGGGNPVPPGFTDDFPGIAGVCASCHAPGLGVDGYLATDMNAAHGVDTAGIHCDYCHKLGGVYINPATGSVYDNAPGVESSRVLRPPEGDNIFFGPYDDIHDPDTYLPEISESQFCAPCHQFSFWGTPIYESYTEWLASPYAEAGVTCQDCHMPPNGDEYFALPEVGGLPHPPESIPSHLQLGASSQSLLETTVTMDVLAAIQGDSLVVTVTITNTGAGHHVPTDYPGRQLLLFVVAADGTGTPLTQTAGPTLPDWAGTGGGSPGTGYAKILRDAVTGEMPVVNYWVHTLIDSDNRIPAMGVSRTVYIFNMPGAAGVEVEVSLVLRRVFEAVGSAKGWDAPDTLMEHAHISIP
jgi:hypothetical protein